MATVSAKLSRTVATTLALWFSACGFIITSSEYISPAIEKRVAETQPRVRLTVKEYLANKSRWKGEVIEIHGRVRRIIDKGGTPVVIFEPDVGCFFGRLRKATVREVIAGETTTIRGWVDPDLMGGLDACLIVGKHK